MESLLEELLKKSDITTKDKFYRQFSCLVSNDKDNVIDIEAVITKIWKLVQKHVISKNILYLFLLLNKNVDLLEKCISWDKFALDMNFKHVFKDPLLLFDYTVYTKRHWLDNVFKSSGFITKETLPNLVYHNFFYLKVIKMTNECGDFNKTVLEDTIKECDSTEIDNFWIYYVKEIEHILKLLEFCKSKNPSINEFEFLNYASQNCILEVGSEYLKLCSDHSNLEHLLIELVPSLIPHEEDLKSQVKCLFSYSILAEFLKLVIPYNNKSTNININDVVKEIQLRLLNINDHSLQIEILQTIFASTFIKQNDVYCLQNNSQHSSKNYICKEKEIRIILFTLKSVVEEIKFKKIYQNDPNNLSQLNELHKMVTDATWRLELIANVIDSSKCGANLFRYLLAEPESLITICLKNGDVIRALQVLKIFNLESTSLAKEIIFNENLDELKETFKMTSKIREIHQDTPDVTVPNIKLQFDDIAEEFFQKHPMLDFHESETVIQNNIELYPFLEHYKPDSELVMNILDLAITQTETFDDSRALLHLASKYNTLSGQESTFSSFSRKLLILFNEIGSKQNLTLSSILLNPNITLDRDKYQKEEVFFTTLQNFYTDFCQSLVIDERGVLSKDHPSHKLFQNIYKQCSDYLEETSSHSNELIKYLQKLFNYLKAFSKILYIEKDSSELISNGKNASYFYLLTYNRSELMGKLLFQENLDPTEFETYFGKLKLDFLYHVVGNCFPTINLHSQENVAKEELYPENILYPPNQAIITYIKKRNWLLALIINEMYKLEDIDVGESRIQNFINYLRLPKIDNLQPLFKYSEIVTALQNEIGYQKVHDFVYAEIAKHEYMSSTHTSHSGHSLETAEEINEDELKTTNWRKLFNIVDSIPEKQLRKNKDFICMRDMILVHLVKDAFECEYYKFTLEIFDRNTRIDLLLDNMKAWPEDFCINSIKSEISRFDQEIDEKIDELKVWLKHIEHSKKVMAVLGVTTWASMYDICTFHPKEVLHKLLASEKIDLLLEFIELHEVSNTMLLCIDEEFLENAFDMGVELPFIKRLLNILPQEHAINVCQNLLGLLKNVKHLQFITHFLMKRTNDDTLGNVALSLKMLSVFTNSEFDQQLLFLLRDPMSIIEVLIMNTKLDKLAAVLDIIRSSIPITEFNEEPISVEKIDELLRRYAEKSLDFRVIAQPDPRLLRTPDHKLLQSLDSINLDPSAKVFVMPEKVPTKHEWIGNTDVIECMCCMNVFFSMFNRRHHCRRCGRVICSSCSTKRMIVPTYEDILVRVCTNCFEQTFRDASVIDDTTSTKSVLDDYWMLTNDSEHNRIVREEFSYEFAPSVSLCLSLMKFHSTCDEYSKFLLEQCDILLKLLIPNQEPLQEIDYMLVIRMLMSLALAAKMVSQDTSLQFGSSSADRILAQAELLGLLAERGCLNLLPTSSNNSSFIDAISLMRLTDKLLEREQWNLALEVSTKAGIDKSGVFVAWGISCLKAGSLSTAREKFSKCLDKNAHHDPGYYDIDSSSLKVIKNPPLLNEIIKILESKKETIDEDVITDHQKFLGSTMTLNQSITSASQPDGAIFILNKLKNLKNIENGYYLPKKQKDDGSKKPKLEEIIYDECVYYLNKYGTGTSLVEFHIKYGHFEKALNCIIKKHLSPDVFVDIYIKCLKHGSVKTLQTHMSEMDSTLSIWKDHLKQICCYMEKRNLLHSLYQLQQYMGDYVRAAMACVRFYEEKAASFTDLLHNSHFLIQSLEHLSQTKEQEQWIAVSTVKTVEFEEAFEETSITSPLIKKMNNEEIEKHTATIKMQIEVTQFLASCETNGIFPMEVFKKIFPNPGINISKNKITLPDVTIYVEKSDNIPRQKVAIPTLFGSPDQRKYLAALCMICGETIERGFELGLRIINEFKLKQVKAYKEVGKYLAQTEKFSEIAELVSCIQNSSDTTDVRDVCDEMLIFAVATLKNTKASEAHVEELIKLISDKTVKISAYIEAKQLKTAYFLATKYKRVIDLKRIMWEAELSNQIAIKVLCQKAIQKYSHLPSTSTDN